MVSQQCSFTCLLLLGILVFIPSDPSTASDKEPLAAVLLKADQSHADLSGHIQIWPDPDNVGDIATILKFPADHPFRPQSGDEFNFGYVPGSYWYRFAVRHPGDQDVPRQWILELAYPTLDAVDVYLRRSAGRLERFQMGDRRQAPPAQLEHRDFAIPLSLDSGEKLDIYLRVSNSALHYVPIRLIEQRAFLKEALIGNLIQGAIFGSVIMITLYNLIIFLSIRDQIYIYYLFWASSLCGFGLVLTGYARQFGNEWFAAAPELIHASLPFFWFFIGYSTILLTRSFVDTRQRTPQWHRLSNLVLMVQTGWLLLMAFVPFSLSIQVSILMTGVATFIAMLAATWHAWMGSRRARLYLLAWGPLFLVILIGVVTVFAELEGIENLIYIAEFCVMLGVGLVSLALADRIHEETEAASQALHNMQRLRSFLPEHVADIATDTGELNLLEPKRRFVTVCVIDLRGFTPVTDSSSPEDVLAVLKGFFQTMGEIVERHGGTVEHFAGDSMVIFYNAPLEIDKPEEQSIRAAIEMRELFERLRSIWSRDGIALGLGIGIANGEATVGAIGFAGRHQYAAIGSVTNLASRLCSMAEHGEILTTKEVLASLEQPVGADFQGDVQIKGFKRRVPVMKIVDRVDSPMDTAELQDVLELG